MVQCAIGGTMPARKDYATTHVCTKCERTQPISNFWKSAKRRQDGTQAYRAVCKECQTKQSNVYSRNAALSNYGISHEIYEAERKKQDYKCLICDKHETEERLSKLNIDHDHKTGKYRGLLCSTCNKGLGLFFDNTEILQKAIEYLNANRT
jgi:hypothetical protein